MQRTIIVKGEGKVVAKVDYVIIKMNMESEDKEYQKAMDLATERIDSLNSLLISIGFEKDDLKTTNFNVRTIYDSVKDKNGNYKQVFRGYLVIHDLKLGFDFDSKRLAKVLTAISKCASKPHLSITFTVKDETAIKEEMLRLTASNARRKAEILCEGSGVKLGELITINYNWNEIDIYSHTSYDLDTGTRFASSIKSDMEFAPEDIEVKDSATFIWKIM
ncbi:MAG: SIMPL domain-containing protein [Erysipelotrichaceae bacterium]|jgi:uncharacterized protein YggE